MANHKQKISGIMSDLEMAFMYASKELPSPWVIRIEITAGAPSVDLHLLGRRVDCGYQHNVADAISAAVWTAQKLSFDEDTNEPDRLAVMHGKEQSNVGTDAQEG